ncbi:hypothetical protein KGF54_002334 [Candida jiufengensis]|uniref:uncharacterized protein n=1 Tax=Candida jiufengensis TaxID=497108 RepID=UPI0022254E40|nr:uncharacterized protein KGF54_002334 [Candida jiufengensis]KAI5954559.1 hypothetical protein KGF54_002334 [Candida jiufengensis]
MKVSGSIGILFCIINLFIFATSLDVKHSYRHKPTKSDQYIYIIDFIKDKNHKINSIDLSKVNDDLIEDHLGIIGFIDQGQFYNPQELLNLRNKYFDQIGNELKEKFTSLETLEFITDLAQIFAPYKYAPKLADHFNKLNVNDYGSKFIDSFKNLDYGGYGSKFVDTIKKSGIDEKLDTNFHDYKQKFVDTYDKLGTNVNEYKSNLMAYLNLSLSRII